MYSEIFHSIQGEGKYTGVPTAWLRFFKCNLQCDGFGQKDPTDPSTYELPYKTVDVNSIKRLEDLPVFEKGCDSSYSWSKKFKHLQHEGTVEEVAERITDMLKTEENPKGKFWYRKNNGYVVQQHLCFTGGEPLLKNTQLETVELMSYFEEQGNNPSMVTYETNGTRELTDVFYDYWRYISTVPLFFSVSPKLFNVSGEENKVQPKVLEKYFMMSLEDYYVTGQLKFVMVDTEEAWNELDEAVKSLLDVGCNWPVYIMPVGATVEGQNDVAGSIAEKAFKRGYHVSSRVHTYLWGNKIGT